MMPKIISKKFSFRVSEKVKNFATLFSLVVGILCGLFYLKYDNKGFEYGLGCNFCEEKLPYNLIPKIDQYSSFTLNDEDDFELVGIGFGYIKSSFIIKDFLAYGYNDTSIIVKCTDSLHNIKYLISYETSYKSDKGNPSISFKDIDNNQIKGRYHWVEIDEEKVNTIRFMKFLFIVGALLSLFLIVRKLLRSKNNKATSAARNV
jgi:hypothetical protein